MAVATTYTASVIASCAAPMFVDTRAAVRMRAVQAPISGRAEGTRMPIYRFPAGSADVGAVRPARDVKTVHRVMTDVPSTTKQLATIGALIGATPGRSTWRPPD